MIDISPESANETLVVCATGILSAADYETRFQPVVEKLIAEHGKINLVFYLDEMFEGWDLGAMWDDAKFGMKHRHDFKRVAVVGAQSWFKWAYQVGAKFMDGQFHTFSQNDLVGAIAWAKAPLPPSVEKAAATS
jgi:hypothetical protein